MKTFLIAVSLIFFFAAGSFAQSEPKSSCCPSAKVTKAEVKEAGDSKFCVVPEDGESHVSFTSNTEKKGCSSAKTVSAEDKTTGCCASGEKAELMVE
jgi:hypothetical protein